MPIVVAVNKVDKEGANPDKIRQQLTEYNLVAEEYGGDTMFVDVSATPGHEHRRAARGRPAHRGRRARPAGQPRQGRPRCRDRGQPRQGPRLRWPPCWSSPARCRSATRSSPARPTAASVRCSTSTATTSTEAARRVRSRCSVWPRSRAPVTRSSWPPTTAPPARSPRSVRPPTVSAVAGQAPQAHQPGGLHRGPRRGQGRDPQPHPQGRRVRFGRGARGRAAARSTSATRSTCGSSTAVSVRSRRTTSTWRGSTRRSSSASTSGPRSVIAELAEREGVDDALLLGHLPGDRRRSRRPSRACSSRSTRRCSSAPPRSARSSAPPSSATSPARSSAPARSGAAPRRGSSATAPSSADERRDHRSAPLQGRRHRGPRGLRVRYQPR